MNQSITRFAALGFVLLWNVSALAGQAAQGRNADRAILGSAVPSPKSPGTDETSYLLSILVFNHAGVGSAELGEAQQKVAAIFGKAGIDVEWRRFSRSAGLESPPARDAVGREALPLNLILPAEKAYPKMKKYFGLPKTTLGFTLPRPDDAARGDKVYVFVHLVRELVRGDAFARPALVLGHIIAHELGHLLLGRGHSLNGLMSAGNGELALKPAGAGRRLHFTRKQARRIRRAARERIETLSEGSVPVAAK